MTQAESEQTKLRLRKVERDGSSLDFCGLCWRCERGSDTVYPFASQVRASRRDMDAVSRELSSLQMCLETLRDDAVTINYPPRIKHILKNCEAKINEMVVLLVTVEARNLGRGLQWTVVCRDQVNGMRAGLEAYESSLEIALGVASTMLITSVQETTDATRRDIVLIRQDIA